MKTTKITRLFIALLFVSTVSSCKKDDTNINNQNKNKAKYILALRTPSSGKSTADYLLSTNDLMSGKISAVGQGVEQIGWRYFTSTSGRYLSVGYGDNNIQGYTFDENTERLNNYGKMVFERLDMDAPISDNEILGIGAPWGGGTDVCTMMIINTEKLKATTQKKVKLSDLTLKDQEYLWPTSARKVGDKLFLSFYLVKGKKFETPVTDRAWVSVFSYPELEFIKTIEDQRTGPLGQYGNSRMMIKTETGDLYCFSSCSIEAGFDTETKPSGVLRIKNGKTEFDSSYFFNIEEKSSKGYEVVFTQYLGNGLVFARVVTNEGGDVKWAAAKETLTPCKYVILNLFDKTVKDIEGLPTTSGSMPGSALYDENKVYVSIHNDETFIYQIDPIKATATKGAKIDGIDAPGIFKIEKAQ